jgi:polysaccharide chain length determinant protein (PEP-CTERM system associated)
MHELLAQLETHARMAWRYRWFGLVAAVAICLIGWTVVLLMPDKYAVSAKVYLDTSTMLTPVLRGIALDQSARLGGISMIRRTLLTRPNLESIARTADLDLKTRAPQEFEALIDRLAGDLSFTETRNSDIYTILYANPDPRVANRVVEAVLNLFVEKSLGESRKDSRATREFLVQQIKDHEQRMEQSEARLKNFKQENMGLLPGSGQSYFSRKEAQRAQIQEALLQLEEAERRRDEIQNQLDEVDEWFEPGTPMAEAAVPHALDARIQTLQAGLDELLMKYTDRHPDVIAGQRLLADLKRQREQDLKASAGAGQKSAAQRERVENPLFQQLNVSFGAAEAEVAALKARVEEFKRREQELGKLVDRALEVEAEEARLNRDYDAVKRNHAQLVARLEALNISDDAAKSSDAFKFNVVEPPRVPSEPSSPNRPLLNALVLAVAFGGGAGLAWLLGMLRPAVYSREVFSEMTDLPVIGSISRVMSRAERREHRVRVALFAAGCVSLLAGMGFILLFESQLMSGLTDLRAFAVEML